MTTDDIKAGANDAGNTAGTASPLTVARYSPGPLEVRPSSRHGNGTGWRDIVSLSGSFGPYYVGEAMEADATLFAASHDMLAALQYSVRYIEATDQADLRPILILSRAAIAKATNCADPAGTNLFAAAPELLEALGQIERLSRTADQKLVDVPAMLGDIARAAIAKATGA